MGHCRAAVVQGRCSVVTSIRRSCKTITRPSWRADKNAHTRGHSWSRSAGLGTCMSARTKGKSSKYSYRMAAVYAAVYYSGATCCTLGRHTNSPISLPYGRCQCHDAGCFGMPCWHLHGLHARGSLAWLGQRLCSGYLACGASETETPAAPDWDSLVPEHVVGHCRAAVVAARRIATP